MNLNFVETRLNSITKNADFAMRGEEIVKNGTVRLGPFSAVSYVLDWSQDPLKNRSWQWRWATLSALTYLIAYHSKSSDPIALKIGYELISSWTTNFLHTSSVDSEINEFAWHDHGTALRAEHVLWFYAYVQKQHQGIKDLHLNDGTVISFDEFLKQHAAVLADNEFYSANTNHGLEQARVLFLLSKIGAERWIPAAVWRDIALDRIRAEFDYAYTPEGVHVENSPAYHIFVFKVFISIVQDYELEELGDWADDFMARARLILNYITHILRPDGLTPIIGDSEKLRPTDSFRKLLGHTEEYKKFQYAFSLGKFGIRPSSTFQVYPLSGYAVYRNQWADHSCYADVIHAIFKGGPLSQYHRQEDEGNLLLYAFGEDWLIDSGMYNYNKNDIIRKYVRSKMAHNVVVVDGVQYKPWESIKSEWALTEKCLDSGKQAIDFCFSGFDHVIKSRRVKFDGPSIEVNDIVRISDGNSRPVRVLWHIDADKQIIALNHSEIEIRSTKTRRNLKLKIHSNLQFRISVKSGVSGQRVFSVTSDIANKYVSSQLIEINFDAATLTEVTSLMSFGSF